MKLIGTIEPFSGMQSIHVYDDNNQEKEYRLAYLHNYANVVLGLLEEYPDVTEFNLHGAEQLCQKVKDEIESNLLSKYENKHRIEVKII